MEFGSYSGSRRHLVDMFVSNCHKLKMFFKIIKNNEVCLVFTVVSEHLLDKTQPFNQKVPDVM